METNLTVEDIKLAKYELSKKINILLHDFVKETGEVPCAECIARTSDTLVLGEMKRTSVTFDINIKIWI